MNNTEEVEREELNHGTRGKDGKTRKEAEGFRTRISPSLERGLVRQKNGGEPGSPPRIFQEEDYGESESNEKMYELV